MYETNEHRRNAIRPKPLSIRLPAIVPDEKVLYIDSVCSALIDSRFGPGRSRPLITRLSEWPELEDATFYDATLTGPSPSYTILPNSEMARRYSEDIIRKALTPPNPYTTIIHIRPDHSPTQGRGSP